MEYIALQMVILTFLFLINMIPSMYNKWSTTCSQFGKYWTQIPQIGRGSPLCYLRCNLLLLHPRNRISPMIPRAPACCSSRTICPLLVNTNATILYNHSPQSPSKMARHYHIPTTYPLLCLYTVQHLPPEAQWNEIGIHIPRPQNPLIHHYKITVF